MSADPEITLKLPLSSVNYTLQSLAQRPYAEVNGLIAGIQQQAQEQLAPKPVPVPVPEADGQAGAPVAPVH